jgi:choice-of-anchor A domain-containing protein
MKVFPVLLTSIVVLSTYAQAESIFDYVAYSKKGIVAECSDFLGKTASAGPIQLADFLIRSPDFNSCALSSRSSVTMSRGGVQYSDESWSCVSSNNIQGSGTYQPSRRGKLSPAYDLLNTELDQLSSMLSNARTSGDVVVMNIDGLKALSSNTLTLKASAKETLVINVAGKEVRIQNLGIRIEGGITEKSIIWNFAEAERVIIRSSGANPGEFGQVGIPGTFVAPKATVYFNDARITGALYAAKIIGKAETPGICVGSVSGQINPGCFVSRSLGIGCGTAPTPRPQPPQDQDQRQEPVPGQQQN